MQIPNLRSPNTSTNGILYFARMVDKIRLHAASQLPEDYVPNLGIAFDERAVNFLGIPYAALSEEVKLGRTDEELLAWAFAKGRQPSPEEIEIWNEFMRKRGWNDEASERLQQRKAEAGIAAREDIQTFFDFIDADEGRK